MGKKRRAIIIMIILLLIGVSCFVIMWADESNWNPVDYARITAVDYKAVIVDEPASNGKILITERLTFDIHAASTGNLFWELWRALPEKYVDGIKVSYQVNYVKQIFDDGRKPLEYSQSPKLYWDDDNYVNTASGLGPGKWYHSKGPYDESLRQYECVLFYVDGLYRDTVVFEIEYEMYNAALRYADSSELYITLYSESEINFLKSYQAQILFPEDKMPRAGNYDAFTYGTNSHSFPFTESAAKNPGYHTFSFELTAAQLMFRPYNQYIEFDLVSYGEDKHIFTQYASKNYYYNDRALTEIRQEQAKYEALPGAFKKAKIIVVLLSAAGVFLLLLFVFTVDKRMKKKYTFFQPAAQMDYFRDIPSDLDPNFASALAFCRHKAQKADQDGYAAVMLSLVRKGYIELERYRFGNQQDWTSNNVRIIVKQKPPLRSETSQTREEALAQEQITANMIPLSPTEEQYFNLILRHVNGREISLSSFQKMVSEDYEHTHSFVGGIKNAIINIGVSAGYFQKAAYKTLQKQVQGLAVFFGITGVLLVTAVNAISYQTRLDLAFGAFFILGLGFIVSAVYLGRLANKYVLLTQFGEDEYAKWRGLYCFLNSETLMKERSVVEIPLWENYLIYATAFGISKKVIKALEIRCPNVDTSPLLGNPYYRSRVFYHSSRSFRTAAHTASFTAQSGGYGGHGGYGGGGRGGGGGGGGH